MIFQENMTMLSSFSRTFLPCIVGILFAAAGLAFFLASECGSGEKGKEKASSRESAVVSILREAMPSVVNISTKRIIRESTGENAFPFSPLPSGRVADSASAPGRESYSLGSGSVIDSSGLILTTAHVIHRASEIDITLSNGQVYQAQTLAADNQNDIALLRLLNPPATLIPIRIAQVNDLLIGETVIAVGNPFGLDSSVTVGILSATHRKFTYRGKTLFSDILQTDAGVYPGNSGGPLINMDGDMIGMNMSSFKDAPRIGFAIPLLRIENTLAGWMIPEKLHSLSLGILPQVRVSVEGQKPEIFIAEVLEGSPASRAGITPGSVLEEFNGADCKSLPGLCRQLTKLKAEETVTLRLRGKNTVFRLKLEPLRHPDGLELAKKKLHLSLRLLTPQLAELLHFPFHSGVILDDLPGNSGLPLRRGDMLVSLNAHRINSPTDLAQALEKTSPGERIQAEFISFSSAAGNPVPQRKNNGGGVFLIKRRVILTVR